MRLKKISYEDPFHKDDVNRVYFAKLQISGKEAIISKFYMHVKLSQIPYIRVVATFKQKIQDMLKQTAEFELSHFVKQDGKSKEYKISFKMIIVRYKFATSSSPQRTYCYSLDCYHAMYTMTMTGKNRVFKDRSLSEILKTVAEECGVECVFSFSTKNIKYTVIQLNESNYEFMTKICSHMNIGYFCDFENGKIIFGDSETVYTKKQELPTFYKKVKSFSESMYLNKYTFKYRNKFQKAHESADNSHDSIHFNANTMDWYFGYFKDFSKDFTNSFLSKNSVSVAYVIRNLLHFGLMPGVLVCDFVVYDVIISHGFFQKKELKVRSRIRFANKVSVVPVEHKHVPLPMLFGTIIEKDNDVFFDDTDGAYAVKLLPHFEKDEQNFLLARIISPFAGSKHGIVFWPRHGDEVVFSFADSMCTQPIILGSLFNADNPTLVKDVNMSYLYFNSLKSSDNAKPMNAITINNKKDSEALDISGAKDISIVTKEVLKTTSKSITTKVEEQCEYECKNVSIVASEELKLKGKTQSVESEKEYTIKVGNSSITIKDSEIELSTEKLTLSVKDKVSISAQTISIDAKKEASFGVGDVKLALASADAELTAGKSKLVMQAASIKLDLGGTSLTVSPTGVSVM